ncbi:MAG TPA: hypothetical protein VG893_13650 [Terracidiphilus sp.]|nr:hypothetical protein [Terracidiphilus sp.]
MLWAAERAGQRTGKFHRLPGLCCLCLPLIAPGAAALAQDAAPVKQWLEQHNRSGLAMKAQDAAWYDSANGEEFRAWHAAVDAYLKHPSGTTADDALAAAQVLRLYRVTQKAEYYTAASRMRDAFAAACPGPDTKAACAAAAPFLAEYAEVFHEPDALGPIADELLKRAKTEPDARMAMALVDALGFFPDNRAESAAMKAALAETVSSALQAATKKADVEDRALLVYAVLKGARRGYLPAVDAVRALRVWRAMPEPLGGGAPGAARLLAATEVDLAPDAQLARGKTILIDAWFNSQTRKNAAGQTVLFHYKWDDYSDSGFSLLGHMFRGVGMRTGTLAEAPTQANLRGAQYFMIVSPDIPVKNPHPHYMTEQDADEVAAWVEKGGVLILMENDPPNADLDHLNLLADKFGIHFDDVLHHHVLGEQVESGRIPVAADGPIFHAPHTFYMKDTCAISLHGAARALLRDRGDVVMAEARHGHGLVFAVVDPWLYNEYTDGRKIPPQIYAQFDNFAGGRELVRWLARQPRVAGTGAGTR